MSSWSYEDGEMMIEDQLRERLRKIEALFLGAATDGERDAAEAAFARLKAKLDEAKPFVWRADPNTIIAARSRGFQALESIH